MLHERVREGVVKELLVVERTKRGAALFKQEEYFVFRKGRVKTVGRLRINL